MDLQEIARETLVKVTGLIPNETVAGLAFGFGLIASEYVIGVLPWK